MYSQEKCYVYEKWNISCHNSKQECHSHQRLQLPNISQSALRALKKKNTCDIAAIRLKPLPRVSPKGVQDVKPQDVCILSQFSHEQLCKPMDYSPPGSSVHGILQARIVKWATMPSSGDFPHPGIKPASPPLAGGFFATSTTWEAPKQDAGPSS